MCSSWKPSSLTWLRNPPRTPSMVLPQTSEPPQRFCPCSQCCHRKWGRFVEDKERDVWPIEVNRKGHCHPEMNLLWSSRCSIYIFNRDRSERQSTLTLKDFGCIFIHFRAVDLDQFRVEKQRILKQRKEIENNLWHWFGRNAFSLNLRNWFKKSHHLKMSATSHFLYLARQKETFSLCFLVFIVLKTCS